jgi:hypothetical protein
MAVIARCNATEGSASFLEKKKQKTSIHWSPVPRLPHTPNRETFFASFLQKEALACFTYACNANNNKVRPGTS